MYMIDIKIGHKSSQYLLSKYSIIRLYDGNVHVRVHITL